MAEQPAPHLCTEGILPPFTAAHGSTVFISWFDRRDLNDAEIYAKFSTDDGATWGPEQRLTDNTVDDLPLGTALTSGFAHVVWVRGDRIYYARRPLPR